jgi:hypothetical protein
MCALTVGCGRDPILGTRVAALAPTVTVVTPAPNATGVPTNNTIINATFSEPMNLLTGAASFTVTCAAPCNQKLSTQRAQAVRDYLVESLGIPSSKTDVKGMDGADPVTKPNECVGQKRTPKLIACLQPDRRVEVEVSGTK